MSDVIPPNKLLNELLLNQACHELGIVPLSSNTYHDVNRVLRTLPPDEARRARRRFRKLWRKFAKNSGMVLPKEYIKQLGLGSPDPSRDARRWRKMEVRRRIMQNVVAPALQRNSEK